MAKVVDKLGIAIDIGDTVAFATHASRHANLRVGKVDDLLLNPNGTMLKIKFNVSGFNYSIKRLPAEVVCTFGDVKHEQG